MPATASAMITEEDHLRAQVYGFLSAHLLAPPDTQALAQIANLTGDDSPIGQGFRALTDIAESSSAQSVKEEYQDLFIGIGRGELVPFGSYYLTGFLNEKPLAQLRATMNELGVERADGVKEPEDHIGSVFEIMAGLITGLYGDPAPLDVQARMFRDHIAPWAGHFFTDLEKANNAKLYAPIGTIGRVFVEIETQAFQMD